MGCMPWMDKGMHGLATAAVLSRIRLRSSSLTPPPQARQRGRRIWIWIGYYWLFLLDVAPLHQLIHLLWQMRTTLCWHGIRPRLPWESCIVKHPKAARWTCCCTDTWHHEFPMLNITTCFEPPKTTTFFSDQQILPLVPTDLTCVPRAVFFEVDLSVRALLWI